MGRRLRDVPRFRHRPNAEPRADDDYRQPGLWSASECAVMPPPVPGQYPEGFIAWALRTMGLEASRRQSVLHVCSGALPPGDGLRIDVRAEAHPDVVATGEKLPLLDGCVPGVMIDPPYSENYARDLYGVAYPRVSRLLAEAARVVVPGGPIGVLHPVVHNPPRGAAIERVWGVTTGCGYRVRAWVVYRAAPARLFPAEALT